MYVVPEVHTERLCQSNDNSEILQVSRSAWTKCQLNHSEVWDPQCGIKIAGCPRDVSWACPTLCVTSGPPSDPDGINATFLGTLSASLLSSVVCPRETSVLGRDAYHSRFSEVNSYGLEMRLFKSTVFRNSSTSLCIMAQLARSLFGHTVSWHADKRVLDDLRGAQTAMVSVRAFLLLAVNCFKLSGHWRPR